MREAIFGKNNRMFLAYIVLSFNLIHELSLISNIANFTLTPSTGLQNKHDSPVWIFNVDDGSL